MPLSLFIRTRPLACLRMAQIRLDHIQHAGSGAFRFPLDRRVGALGHACRMLARRVPSRVQAHCRHIAKNDTTRSTMFVSILINPRTLPGTERTEPKAAAARV